MSRFFVRAMLLLVCSLHSFSLFAADKNSHQDTVSKVYEMRTYHTHDGKLDALHARFRDHTHQIFGRLGMKVVACWTPTQSPDSENTLIYIIEHNSEQDAKNKWKTFIADPAWVEAFNASKKNGDLVKKIDVVFMHKTDFSPSL
ncbi:NIPSNAP family protein [uncultured Paraglaciecola sp.]|jgi:hypothetical protein|uniref:NIPSNAP family protein n=1 Tax=uncultured Paraglaciecola sp. TaxID=1765024 RepID=UPI002638A2F6|nr:NIPSNAP family protein [uncultured Paraglaciecola sp.]